MQIRKLSIIVVCLAFLFVSLGAFGQTWDEEERGEAKSILEEKFELGESLTFNPEGALETDTFRALPASVSITPEGLDEGIAVALIEYGEETFLPCFVAFISESDSPYGFALIAEGEGEAVVFGPAEIEGTDEGPENPEAELLEEGEEHYRVAFKFAEATVRVSLPKKVD